jgi:hypothetical protein
MQQQRNEPTLKFRPPKAIDLGRDYRGYHIKEGEGQLQMHNIHQLAWEAVLRPGASQSIP